MHLPLLQPPQSATTACVRRDSACDRRDSASDWRRDPACYWRRDPIYTCLSGSCTRVWSCEDSCQEREGTTYRNIHRDVRLEDWLPTLECAAKWNGCGEEETLMQLADHLCGHASQEWGLIPETEKSWCTL